MDVAQLPPRPLLLVLLLVHLAPPAVASGAVDGAGSGTDFTLQYFGQHRVNILFPSQGAAGWVPAEYCDKHDALICMELHLDECTVAPLGLPPPYSQEVVAGAPGTGGTASPPRLGEAGIGYVLLTAGRGSSSLAFWSRCDEGCEDCRNGTGRVWDVAPEVLGMCTCTRLRGVFRWMSGRSQQVTRCTTEVAGVSLAQRCLHVVLLVASITLPPVILWLLVALWSQCSGGSKHVISRGDIERRFPPSRVGGAELAETCMICLANLKEGELCRRLECRHVYHAECILKWWTCTPRTVIWCPCCRQRQGAAALPRGEAAAP